MYGLPKKRPVYRVRSIAGSIPPIGFFSREELLSRIAPWGILNSLCGTRRFDWILSPRHSKVSGQRPHL